MRKFVILTDLEGVAGTEKFTQTRTRDVGPKGPSMKQLAREVNAAVEGIRSVVPGAIVDVIDGHGPGGLMPEDLKESNYVRRSEDRNPTNHLEGYEALLFVGQHAMAGMYNAPLCHTYSSLNVMYYRLNDTFIGEFAAISLKAGVQGVPTIFLSGDDKAVMEAKMFIPEIETVTTKIGLGVERAEHRDQQEVCDLIREGAACAVGRMGDIEPFTAFKPPYRFEARHYEPLNASILARKDITVVDDRTYRIETDDLFVLPI